MRKVVCFALLALTALAADQGARHELAPAFSDASGFAEVWTSPGQVGIRVQIDGRANTEYAVALKAPGTSTTTAPRAGTFETDARGRGVGGGFVAVDPAWDADGDGVITVWIFVSETATPPVPRLSSALFDLQLR